MKTTFTDYIKGKFIETGEVNKDNFEDLYPEWLNQLEDEELDEFAYEWKRQELKKWVELTDKAIQELQVIKKIINP